MRVLVAFVPDCVTAVKRLKSHPAVPRRVKTAVVLAGVYLAGPIDLIPEFLTVIGPLDDVVAVALVLRHAARSVRRDVTLAAWPGERRLIDLLIGAPRDVSGN